VNQPRYDGIAPLEALNEPRYVDFASPFDPPTESTYAPVPGEVGQGFLGKLTKSIYWYGTLTLLLAIASAPAWLVASMLVPDMSNVPLYALALAPIGPAISAGLYTVRARYRSEDAGPWRAFWRGYRQSFDPVMRVWLPALLVLAIIGFTLTFGFVIGLQSFYRVGLLILGVLVTAWAVHAIAISTFFHFSVSDTARLAAHQLAANWRATLGLIAVAILAFGLVWFLNPLVIIAVSGVLAYLLYQQERSMLNHVYNNFTVH